MWKENRLKIYKISVIIITLFTLSYLTLKRHADTGYFNWRAELFADQAGYYVYLPALFIYNFNAEDLPDSIVGKTGNGFLINENNKIQTKYTYGVSLMESPFFLLIHAHTLTTKHKNDGFSENYHYVPVLSAIFYSFLGLLFLFKFLGFYFSSKRLRYLILLLIFFGTNLYFYVVDYSGMSHIYSFALISSFLFLIKKELSTQEIFAKRNFRWIYISLIFALIILIRPVNVIFGLLFFIDCENIEDIKKRFIYLFSLKKVVILFVSVFTILLPQFIYWKTIYGQWLKYSYDGEGFIYWSHPKIFEVLFSPNNGIFLYAPLTLIIILGLIYMIRKKIKNAYIITILFLFVIYLTASWHIYSFGAGFGCRNMVEFYAVLSLPLGYILKYFLENKNKWQKYTFIVFVFSSIFITQKLTYSYDRCFLGEGNWDFKEYQRLLKHKKYYHIAFGGIEQHFSADENEMSKGVWIKPSDIGFTNFSHVAIECEVEGISVQNEGFYIIFYVMQNDSNIAWNEKIIYLKSGETKIESFNFGIPSNATIDNIIGIQIWNKNKNTFIIKRFSITYI